MDGWFLSASGFYDRNVCRAEWEEIRNKVQVVSLCDSDLWD